MRERVRRMDRHTDKGPTHEVLDRGETLAEKRITRLRDVDLARPCRTLLLCELPAHRQVQMA